MPPPATRTTKATTEPATVPPPASRSSASTNRTIPVPSLTRLSISTIVASRRGTAIRRNVERTAAGSVAATIAPTRNPSVGLSAVVDARTTATIAATITTPGIASTRIGTSAVRRTSRSVRKAASKTRPGRTIARRRPGGTGTPTSGPTTDTPSPTSTSPTDAGIPLRPATRATPTVATRIATSSQIGPSSPRLRRSPLGACLPDVDALHDPQAHRQADQRCAAVRDERQRDPGDRHDPDDHPEVHEQLEEDHRREAGREHRPERILRAPTGDEQPPEQRREQDEQDHRADEPELLEVDRRDEIAVGHRQEVELVLAPVRQAGSRPPTRAHRDLRLVDLVSGTLRVERGVEEREDPGALVIVKNPRDVPCRQDQPDGGRSDHREPEQPRAGHPEHAAEDRQHHE